MWPMQPPKIVTLVTSWGCQSVDFVVLMRHANNDETIKYAAQPRQTVCPLSSVLCLLKPGTAIAV